MLIFDKILSVKWPMRPFWHGFDLEVSEISGFDMILAAKHDKIDTKILTEWSNSEAKKFK